jgi:hypothetical protein
MDNRHHGGLVSQAIKSFPAPLFLFGVGCAAVEQ